jgi:hypothetical protein
MIYFSFAIQNPWSNKFKNLFCKSGKLTKNKSWEIQCYESEVLVRFSMDINFRKDHGGIDMELGFLGYTISAQIYDNRHWDHEKVKWVEYETN